MAGQENEKLTKQPNIIVGGIFFQEDVTCQETVSDHGISDTSEGPMAYISHEFWAHIWPDIDIFNFEAHFLPKIFFFNNF